MLRKAIVSVVALLVIAGCDRGQSSYLLAEQRLDTPPHSGNESGQVFSYVHLLFLVMPHDSITPRFERARDTCLHDAALNCKLISASLMVSSDPDTSYASATLQIALPHDQIAAFEQSLLAPLPQEGADAVSVQSRSTNAENVGEEATDIDRKITQLTSYRGSLVALAKRSNLSIDDLIKLQGELSKTQSELDEALAQKRDIGERIAKERLTISLGEKPDLASPITRVWRNGVNAFVESTASAIDFLIRVVPWLPIAAGGVLLISLFWRLFRRKKKAASP